MVKIFNPKTELDYFVYEAFKQLLFKLLYTVIPLVAVGIFLFVYYSTIPLVLSICLLFFSLYLLLSKLSDLNKLLKFRSYAESFSVQVIEIDDD